ncbi:MAG: YegS/Rv2252/BmrU family lipid kinase [Bacilli bacterium]
MFLYSEMPGSGKIVKKIDYIVAALQDIFDYVKIIKVDNLVQLFDEAKTSCQHFDVLIFSGGDGTFNHIVNAIAGEEKRPILGYIPAGTLNDFGKNFGLTRNIKRSINTIRKGAVCEFDVGLINNQVYFAYVAAIGTFSEISYATKRKRVRSFGKMAYYVNAVKDAIIPRSFDVDLEIDGKLYHHRVPFFLLLNSKYVGGFPVNLRNALDDGKFDVYLTKPGLFNGLLHYFLLKARTAYYRVNKIRVSPSTNTPWCIDGEEGMAGNLQIICLNKHLRIFTNR